MSVTTSVLLGGHAARPYKRQRCVLYARPKCPAAGRRCCGNDFPQARDMRSVVQGYCHRRAAPAAVSLSFGQRGAGNVRLAGGQSRERMRRANTEGQIKGVARRALPNQSARGFVPAPPSALRVPRRASGPRPSGVCRVPLETRCDGVRWGLHGSR